MSPAPASGTIKLSWDLPHPPAKVWRALTEPALIAQWLMPTDMPAEIGKPFTFRQQPTQWWDGIVHSEVQAIELHKRLRYTWGSGGAQARLATVVTWTLKPIGGGTRLELEHAGFKPTDAFAFDGAGKGWERNVSEQMRAILEQLT